MSFQVSAILTRSDQTRFEQICAFAKALQNQSSFSHSKNNRNCKFARDLKVSRVPIFAATSATSPRITAGTCAQLLCAYFKLPRWNGRSPRRSTAAPPSSIHRSEGAERRAEQLQYSFSGTPIRRYARGFHRTPSTRILRKPKILNENNIFQHNMRYSLGTRIIRHCMQLPPRNALFVVNMCFFASAVQKLLYFSYENPISAAEAIFVVNMCFSVQAARI